MTTTEKVKKYILDNQHITDNELLAKGCDSTDNFIVKCKSELRKEGKLPPLPENFRRKVTEPVKPDDIPAKLKAIFRKKGRSHLRGIVGCF